ncbi:MAG: divergent polysaccharide deacetylase family protein, partial [Candidatus Omnitrophica bacterium]|nr:divergent polysaccharide deacetylase family protein [Candidatus Omnitrophota bacterium]
LVNPADQKKGIVKDVVVEKTKNAPPTRIQNQEIKVVKNNNAGSVTKKTNINVRKPPQKTVAKLPVEILPRIFRPKIKGKIAIVLDDWGNSLNNFDMIKSVKQALTLAILPGLAYSKRIAAEAKRNGFEVILHLPMEPVSRDKAEIEKDTICTDMDDLKIKDVLSAQLNKVPYVKGVNNHMGSLATADSRLMRVIFEELKKRKLYFLDSYTSGASVCSRQAKDCKI